MTLYLTYDPGKDVANKVKHGVSLALALAIDWTEVWCTPDARRDYGELREIGYAPMAGRLYCVGNQPAQGKQPRDRTL
ncbi:BrnT family toxin [Cupriavidus sp. WKF15]|uniref:BrnT family toxin n=1 Tax=Cupriavidus sp. WKF15 TaxID=3032282 RepID=UPI0031FE68A9